MKILVTGATGFIGTHLIKDFIQNGYRPTAAGKDRSKLTALSEAYGVDTVNFDIKSSEKNWYLILGKPDIVIHLAWGALDDFNNSSHFENELPTHYNFLKNIISNGAKKVLVAGTCFEYGLQDGELSENNYTAPIISYAIAKDSLRRYLLLLQKREKYSLTWLRYFYMYCAGQDKKTLLSQLDSAISRGDAVFNMSGGEQLRDYLPVEEVARLTALLATENHGNGIFNICSGEPVSIRKLVEKRTIESGSDIKLNLGFYPYPEYEPMAFWGDRKKIDSILVAKGK